MQLLHDLRPSAALHVQHFTCFDDFRPSDATGAATNIIPLDRTTFSVSRAKLALPAARLVFQRSFSRTFEADFGGEGCGIIVPMSDQFYAEANGRTHDHTNITLLRGRTPARAFEPRPNTTLMLRLHSVMQTRGWDDYETGYDLFT